MSARNTPPLTRAKPKGLLPQNTALLLLALLVVAVILGALYRNPTKSQNLANPPRDPAGLLSPTPFAQTISNQEWLTHLDADNHFSIKYPSSWKVYEESGLGYSFQSPDLSTGYGGEIKKGIYVRFILWKETTNSISPNSPDDEFMNWFVENYGNLEEAKLLSQPKRFDLAGYPAIMAERETFLFGKSITAVIVMSEDSSLVFDCFYDASNKAEATEIFNQMLDTLQILP